MPIHSRHDGELQAPQPYPKWVTQPAPSPDLRSDIFELFASLMPRFGEGVGTFGEMIGGVKRSPGRVLRKSKAFKRCLVYPAVSSKLAIRLLHKSAQTRMRQRE